MDCPPMMTPGTKTTDREFSRAEMPLDSETEVRRWIARLPGLTSAERRLLVALRDREQAQRARGDRGDVIISRDDLAAAVNVHRTTITRCVSRLQARGLLYETRTGRASRYVLADQSEAQAYELDYHAIMQGDPGPRAVRAARGPLRRSIDPRQRTLPFITGCHFGFDDAVGSPGCCVITVGMTLSAATSAPVPRDVAFPECSNATSGAEVAPAECNITPLQASSEPPPCNIVPETLPRAADVATSPFITSSIQRGESLNEFMKPKHELRKIRWGQKIPPEAIRTPRGVQQLYELACRLGLSEGLSMRRTDWFAFCHKVQRVAIAKRIRNPIGLLSKYLAGPDQHGTVWHAWPADEDRVWARDAILRLDAPELVTAGRTSNLAADITADEDRLKAEQVRALQTRWSRR